MRAILLLSVVATVSGCGAPEQNFGDAPTYVEPVRSGFLPGEPPTMRRHHENDYPGGLLADGGPDPSRPPCRVSCCIVEWEFEDAPDTDPACCACEPGSR